MEPNVQCIINNISVQFKLITLQVFKGHIWLVAAILHGATLESIVTRWTVSVSRENLIFFFLRLIKVITNFSSEKNQ